MGRGVLSVLVACALLGSGVALAEVAPERPGLVEVLPDPPEPHWLWVTDPVLERAALLDLDGQRFLGSVNGGYGTLLPLFGSRRPEIYLPATYYSRRTHGQRTDVIEIFDRRTLSHLGEIELPPKRASNAVALAHAALEDEERFLAVFNWTTGTSLSIVDLERRRFVTELETSGCSLVYPAGPRRFFSLCGDGALLLLALDEKGQEASRLRSSPFFPAALDPVTEKAVREGSRWWFVSFEGQVYGVDIGGAAPVFAAPWSLVGPSEAEQGWRTGGTQHLAVHSGRRELFVLMHQGGAGTHKDPGTEVWVYDLASGRRVRRVPLHLPGVTFLGEPVEPGPSWPWPVRRLFDLLLDLAPPSVSAIAVTQDAEPLLVVASPFFGALGVYDARTGDRRGRVLPTGWTSDLLVIPAGATGP